MPKPAPVSPDASPGPVFLAVEDDRVRYVDREIFLVSFVSDCVGHACRCLDNADVVRPDACCQYGADVREPEKAAILKRADEIASVLKPHRRSPAAWFDDREPEPDPDLPFGQIIRTAIADPEVETSGCIFLDHLGARGCGLHVAAEKHGFDPAEVKPSVCRLYPLTLDEGHLSFSPDFYDYSCARSGPTSVYQVMRPTLAQMFGEGVLSALDPLDRKVRARRLKVLDRPQP